MSKASERGTARMNQGWVDDAPKGTHTIGDGLILKVTERGGSLYRAFVLRVQVAGKRKDFQIGSGSKVKLAQAKTLAGAARAAIAAGDDPKAAIKGTSAVPDAFQAKPAHWELTSVVARCFEAQKATLKGEGKAGRWLSPLEQHVLPKLGARQVDSITAEDVRATLKPIWTAKSSVAQKAANRLGIALRFASDEGASVDETAVPKAKRLLGKVPDTSQRIQHTPWEAVPALYQRICGLTVTPATLAVRLALLTAQRAGPVRHARVEQFDLEAGIWTIPADALKGRVGAVEAFRCPLSPEAIRVAELSLPFAVGGKLFPAQRGGGVVSDVGMSKVLNRIEEPGRVHGLRSSFADWAEAQGHSFEMTERCLQHVVGSKVARAYRRDDQLETRRAMMDAWSAYAMTERDAARRATLTVV